METRSFTFKIDDELLKKLETLAQEEDLAVSQLIRRWIREAWNKRVVEQGSLAFTVLHEG